MDIQSRITELFSPRFKVVLQSEAAECGLACLAMASNVHGRETDLVTLRGKYAISIKGTPLDKLMLIATDMKLVARPVEAPVELLHLLDAPAILHWNTNHFVLLIKRTSNGAIIADPAIGKRFVETSELERNYSGIAMELGASDQFEKGEEKASVSIRSLFSQIRGAKKILFQIVCLSIALELFALTSPLMMQLVVDQAVATADRDLLYVIGLGFLMLTITQVGISALRSWMLMYFSTSVNLQWLTNVFSHLIRLPMIYFEKRHLGDIVSRFTSVTTIQSTLTGVFLEVGIDGMLSLTMLIMIFIYSPQLALVTTSAVILYIFLRIALYAPFRQANEEQIALSAKASTSFLESVRGIQTIKLFGREDTRRTKWLNHTIDSQNRSVKTQMMSIGFGSSASLIFGVENIVVVIMGATSVIAGNMSLGMLLAYLSYKGTFTSRMNGLVDKVITLRMLSVHTERVADIVFTDPELLSIANAQIKKPPAIALHNVSFRYSDNEPWVLRDCSFSIDAREYVAVTGPSGCGKTTLLKILVGLLQPTNGSISYDSRNLVDIGLVPVRSAVGTVMQDDRLFAGSVAENIAFFDSRVDREQIQRCAKLANIHEEILAMPLGYNTLVGDMGSSMSGGQRQRILLARALYKEPSVLLLDEATNHLDEGAEQAINSAIENLDITRIIIAHRPTTIASAHRVIKLCSGKA